jgi:hypothetical protein
MVVGSELKWWEEHHPTPIHQVLEFPIRSISYCPPVTAAATLPLSVAAAVAVGATVVAEGDVEFDSVVVQL